GFTLDIAGGALQLRAAGDFEVYLSGVFDFIAGFIEDQVRDRFRDARDRVFQTARDQIRNVLQVQRLVEEILTRIQPSPSDVRFMGVAICHDGITVSGTTLLVSLNSVVVRQVKQGPMVDALDSWIPGGTIDRFRWYRSTQ